MIILCDMSEYFIFLVFIDMLFEIVGVLKICGFVLVVFMVFMVVFDRCCRLELYGVIVEWLFVMLIIGLLKLFFW